MSRTELSELVVHGFQADSIELCFESEMPDAVFELEYLQFGVGQQHGGKKMGACVARVLVGALPIDGFSLQRDTVDEVVLSHCWRNQSFEGSLMRLG